MKIKLDENMPRAAAVLLTDQGHDVRTVLDQGLIGQPDDVLGEAALREDRMVITLDRGFPALASPPREHPGIVVLKLVDQSVPSVRSVLSELLARHTLESLRSCLVIVGADRIRIRRST